MKKHKFLKTLLSSLMALSVVSTAAIPAIAEEAEAEMEVELLEEEPEEEVLETEENNEEEEVELEVELEEEEEEGATGTGSLEFEGKADEVTVTAAAPEGAFPEGTEMTADTVTDTDTLELIKNAVGEDAEVLAAIDITFTSEGEAVQPDEAVKVAFAAAGLEYSENLKVVHVDDKGEEPVATVLDQELITATEDGGIAFDADSFSIYAVVETGENARLLVKFMNGTTEIASTYVKKTDITATAVDGSPLFDQIIYDPGAGELTGSQVFRGWTANSGYTVADVENGLTIDDVRTAVKAKLNAGVTEGEELTYYAMIFNVFNVVYKDEDGVVIKNDSVLTKEASADYTINESYTPKTSDQEFQGWHISPAKNAKLADGTAVVEGTTYENLTALKLTGSIVLTVVAPDGHWLIFKENGQNVSYTPPQFLEGDTPTSEPDDPTRIGYTFVEWRYFPDAADDWEPAYDKTTKTYDLTGAVKFTFNQSLGKTTKLYAVWAAVPTANYTVIIWKQNIAGDGYDFDQIITLSGNTGSTVNTISQQGTGNAAYARINGTNYTGKMSSEHDFTGFHLKAFDNNITIAPEGTSVVNVYYDRTEYTLTFKIGGSFTSSGGSIVPTNPNSSAWSTVRTITAKYGVNISEYFPITNQTSGTKYDGYVWKPYPSTKFSNILVIMDTMPAENITMYGQDRTNDSNRHNFVLRYYLQPTNLSTNHDDYELLSEVTAVYSWVTESEDFIDISGFDHESSDPSFTNGQISYNRNGYIYYDATGDNDNNPAKYGWINDDWARVYWNNGAFRTSNNWNGTEYNGTVYTRADAMIINFYYKRNMAEVLYMDGGYFDGNNNPVEGANNRGTLGTSAQFAYGADISSLNSYKQEYTGYVFSGWYIDSACSQKYTFTTMPKDGVTVYAKWVQVQYRVFLHPNVPSSEANFSLGDQDTSFRVDVGENITAVYGTRDDYELVGWYTDEACTQQFNFEAITLNDGNTHVYDKSLPTERDKYGNPTEPGNKDVDRPWITRSFDLYAKWRSKLLGANGITVVYDADTGSFADGTVTDENGYYHDPLLYKDLAKSTATTATIPADSTKYEFSHWVVQKYENGAFVDTNETVLPGDTFEVKKAYSQVVENEGSTSENPSYTYTVKLRAVYKEIQEETKTHIYWYSNNDPANPKKEVEADENLSMNTPVDIEPATRFSYPGYEFAGWARYPVGEQPSSPTDTSKLWLVYDAQNKQFKCDGVVVSQVACDEQNPYHDLYAVWKYVGQYHVVYSSHPKDVYTYNVPDYTVEGENATRSLLKDLDSANYLYGGYYHYEDFTDVNADVITPAEVYSATKAQQDYWGTQATKRAYSSKLGDKPGDAMQPVAGAYYYVKEVPNYYLAPYLQYYYNTRYGKFLTQMYALTAIDDNRYETVGFAKLASDTESYKGKTYEYGYNDGKSVTHITALPHKYTKVAGTIKFVATSGADGIVDANTVVDSRTDKTNVAGYVASYEISGIAHDNDGEVWYNNITKSFSNTTFNYIPYYVTLDGVTVIGKYLRRVETGLGYQNTLKLIGEDLEPSADADPYTVSNMSF